ncbi:hypothetical protein PMAYCL1PPCAC_06739 [Pristionchus mayeri]|uniref:Copper transport protein n=1 Tax=Pristionchus mayeri TaxID=1317129 RepID=A0AAN5CBW4_9BILA|nr:hypothetical protein PMAYCL1PPCAC_06739 [Pristionchus mayeri]
MIEDGTDGCNCTTMVFDMTLHIGEREIILFSWWKTGSLLGLIGSCLIIFLLAVLYEAIRAFRMWIARFDAIEAASKERVETSEREDETQGRIRSAATLIFTQSPVSSIKMRIVHSLLHSAQTLLGFILMLIVMTFNLWVVYKCNTSNFQFLFQVLLSVVLGMTLGFFIFSGSPHQGDVESH